MSHRLRRGLSRLLLLTAILALIGCPYGLQFPLGDPAEGVIDEALLGAWEGESGEAEAIALEIRASGAGGLVITASSPDGTEAASMPAFVSLLGSERFLNVREEAWYFLNYRIADGRLLLRVVDDALFESSPVASAADLEAFLRANLQDPRLYGEANGEPQWDWVLERTESAAAPAAATAP